jgi:hypothetical protein
MSKILPPEAGLLIQGVYHRYTLTKETDEDATVSLINKHASGNGNIYEMIDNWDNIDGSTKVGFDLVNPSLGVHWGDGSISTTGGELSDVTVAYNYKFDPCFIPLSDPTCPNYQESLLKYLLDNDLINNTPDINDPYYDQWVQFQLELEASEEEEMEEELVEEEVVDELTIEDVLSITGAAQKIADVTEQKQMLNDLMAVGTLDAYYAIKIDGGTLPQSVELKDTTLHDNYKAWRNLDQDKAHFKMVRAQFYKN